MRSGAGIHPAGTPTMPMPRPLLDRQTSLLEYLTSSAAIFGSDDASSTPDLQGIDRRSLHLTARFSHDKRMKKIVASFPKTFELLAENADAVVREFADTCPPVDTSRIENARQFYDFLAAGRRDGPPEPPHLQDVAACELALANASVLGGDRDLNAPKASVGLRGWVCRAPGVVLLRCSYDIRPIFEEHSRGINPTRRDTFLAISFPPGAEHPKVFEVAPMVFNMLAALGDWTDPATLRASTDLNELICELAQHRLVEARG
jgi:hypothetical protein